MDTHYGPSFVYLGKYQKDFIKDVKYEYFFHVFLMHGEYCQLFLELSEIFWLLKDPIKYP